MKLKPVPKIKIGKKESLKESLFAKSFRLAKSSPNKTGLMILFDVLFLVSIFALNSLAAYFAQSLVAPTAASSAVLLIVFSLIYYLIALFAYSFFKYSVLDSIKSLFEKSEFSFKRLAQFYSLNIIIAGIFLAIMLLANYIIAGIRPEYRPFVFIFLAIPYLLFLYVIINISHSLFYRGNSIKDSVKESFSITFTKMGFYRETILIMVLFALALWLLFFGSGYLVRVIGAKNYSLYLNAYAYFKQISIIVLDIVFYFVVLINRISFYSVTKEVK
ncbi:hypothetical protein HYX05_00965 [Candidatus Woesearchaeota archaeon]|nr:hypothetical protein [Candidatus Woesearchaeota archaeon]